MKSATIMLSGNSSQLSCSFYPPLEFEEGAEICLLSLYTNNSIPNITTGCNKIGVQDSEGVTTQITIPTGSYELAQLEAVLKKLLEPYVQSFSLEPDEVTLKSALTCSNAIDFTVTDNIARLLGFNEKVYGPNIRHVSTNIVDILQVNTIYVECNIATGSYDNGQSSKAIHAFFPSVPAGYKIIEVPKSLVYYPLNTTTVYNAEVTLRSQSGKIVDLRGETLTLRLHIRT